MPRHSLVPRALEKEKAIYIYTANDKIVMIFHESITTINSNTNFQKNILRTELISACDLIFDNNYNCDRVSAIMKLLRLDYLSAEEKETVTTLIKTHYDRFYMLHEHLDSIRLYAHKIITSDDIPIVLQTGFLYTVMKS